MLRKGVFRKNKKIRSVLKFENIVSVSSKNINEKREQFLDFLAIESRQMIDKSFELKLIFSGDSIIKLVVEVIDITLDDQGSPWESKTKPKHNFL